MLSSVLNSERAVQVNIAIMRAFVRLRELAASRKDILRRLDEMEEKTLTVWFGDLSQEHVAEEQLAVDALAV